MAEIILLQPKQRLLEKARRYVDFPEEFSANKERAVRDLLQVLPVAEPGLRHRIMMLLAGFAKKHAARPLYDLLKDPDQSPRTRHYAAVQLCVVLPFLDNSAWFVEALLKDIQNSDTQLRRYAVTAMGWQPNERAFLPLAACLYDDDQGVALAAVNALCSCGDKRVLPLLLKKLDVAPVEEKRAILFNLWRLGPASASLTSEYLRYLKHESPELRLASLALLSFSGKHGDDFQLLKQCLADPDHRVRNLALERLVELGPTALANAHQQIRALLNDTNMQIKKAALSALKFFR